MYTRDSGGSGTGGTGGGTDSSVAATAYLPLYNGLRTAIEFVPGDNLLLLNDTRDGTVVGTVINNRTSVQPMVRLVSKSGITLTCSTSTPVTYQDGSAGYVTEVLGKELPVQDEAGWRWEEIVAVEDAGYGVVCTIFCENQCYAAGDVPGRYIWTHNLIIVKP